MTDRFRTTEPEARRTLGLALGALLGLVYGLATQTLIHVLLPGVPLYQPPFGPLGNILAMVLLGAVLGLIATIPDNSVLGVVAASVFAAILIVVTSFAQVQFNENNRAGLITAAIFIMLPLTALVVPVIAVVRWAVHRELEARRDPTPWTARLAVPLALVIVIGLVGVFSLPRRDAFHELTAMHALLQAGLAAATAADLPPPLTDPAIGGFQAQAQGLYTLEWTNKDLNRFRIPRPGRNFDFHAVVLARFANGWRLACLFVTPDEPPVCRSY